jgi:threonine/homoserine/homoserine lactone efflux protein
MPELSVLVIFIPTFFFISITPGMCMSLAMTLGMTIGVKRTLWMMLGEVVGVATVAVAAVLGIASIMLNYPTIFSFLKWLGGIYLIYLGIKMWLSKATLSNQFDVPDISRTSLLSQGFITAIANPKGWAFMISILPPFININRAIEPQLFILVFIIMLSEFICMLLYASGGITLKRLLTKDDKAQWLNRISASLLALVGVWLAIS